MDDELRLNLLGGLHILLGETPVTGFVSTKVVALLAYLAVTGRPHTRPALAGLLWSEAPDVNARKSLRMALYNLRQLVEPHLVITRQTVAFDQGSPYSLDVDMFRREVKRALASTGTTLTAERASALGKAVHLYQGDFLEGVYIPDAPAFEEWALGQREQLRLLALQALHRLVAHHTAQGTYQTGIEYATQLLTIEPWQEEAHRQLMRLLALSGQRQAALTQYETCRRLLAGELDVELEEQTTALYEQIMGGELGRAAVPPAPRHNLPAPMTPLIARQDELARLQELLLDPEYRLVTLVGAGGVGKTRLALAAAELVTGQFAHGTWFFSLAGLVSGADTWPHLHNALALAMAQALGLTLHGDGQPKAQLLDYLRDKEALFVFDSFGPALEGGTRFLQEIIQSAPRVTILVTSRERLDIQAEYAVRVEGLPVPQTADDSAAAAYDSVQLFAERAARARAGFALDEQNLSDVVRICQHLDGLPLGIELAAAKVRRWTPAEIAQSIQHDLDFLTTTQDEVPARHRSLRAVFETSWRQRSPAERQALVQLSVFRGEFSRQAALAVAGATPPDLTALADRSLLHQPATGRYQMSESVRQFAAEKLAALAQEHVVDIPALRDRHSTFYLGFVAQHQAALHGREPHQAVAEILREAQNIRRAWSWAVSQGQFTLIHRGLRSMSRLIRLSGLCLEGEMIFAQAVEQLRAILVTAEQPARDKQFVLGELLAEYACCLNSLARYDQAIAAAQEVVDLALAHHAASLEAVGRLQLGRALRQQGDYAAAQAQVERALAQARAANVPALEANSLDQLGILTARDNYPLARTWLEQALRLYQELGDALGEAEALHDLGLGALSQGIYDGARAYLEQSLRIFCQIDNRWGEAMSCWSLGNVADALGDYVKAQAYYERALGITRLIGERTGEAETLASLAWTLYHQDQDDAAWHVGQQAVDLARTLGNRRIEGRALTALGHALAALGLQAEAITVYRQALSVYQDLGESNLITGPLAGLARVTLVQGNLAQALALADQVLEHLDGLPPSSEGQSFEAYWICYQVLQANQDPRAAEVLHASYHLLQEYAARIGDPVRRRSLLDAPRVAAHRAIIHEFEQSQR